MKRALLLLLAAFLVAPAAAQGTEFSLSAPDTQREFAVGQTTSIPVDVTLGCVHLVEAQGSLTVSLATDLPASWGPSGSDVSFSASPDCLTGGGAITGSGTIEITPTASATGLEKRSFTIYGNASGGEATTFNHASDVWVEYIPGHTVSTDISFPYQFTSDDNGVLRFNVTVTMGANTDSMIMFENLQTQGTLSGLTHQSFFFSQGQTERTRVLPVTWTPPANWDNATISFYNYSHCLVDGFPCEAELEDNVSWQINNEAGASAGGDGKESPSPGFLLVPILAMAALLMRRRG